MAVVPPGLLVAAAEAWTAVLGGLIPIVGLVGAGYLIIRAARDDGTDDE